MIFINIPIAGCHGLVFNAGVTLSKLFDHENNAFYCMSAYHWGSREYAADKDGERETVNGGIYEWTDL